MDKWKVIETDAEGLEATLNSFDSETFALDRIVPCGPLGRGVLVILVRRNAATASFARLPAFPVCPCGFSRSPGHPAGMCSRGEAMRVERALREEKTR